MDQPNSTSSPASVRLSHAKSAILEQWLVTSKAEIESAKHTASELVRDEFLKFLTALSDRLDVETSSAVEKVKVCAKQHGAERARYTGYSLGEIVKEYGLLRATVIASLEASGKLNSTERQIIHRSVDDAIELAINEFDIEQSLELKKALLASETSNAALDQFASVAAHDLRSPLNSIAGFTTLIRERFASQANDETSAWFVYVDNAVSRMSDLIAGILSYARLSSSTSKDFTKVDLAQVLADSIQDLQSDISSAGAVVTFAPLPSIRGDAVLLRQLFQNLISNALKFRGSRPSEIKISSQLRNGSLLIEVKDNGVGFDMKEAEVIFDLHRKIARSNVLGGAGLGLATCRRIAELHNGSISAKSSVQDGTVFTISLPESVLH